MSERSETAARLESAGDFAYPTLDEDKSYSFVAALRPFSLVVALVSCGLGLWLAAPQIGAEAVIAVAVMLGGLLLQCGVNLINDRADLVLIPIDARGAEEARGLIMRNFRAGLLCFAAAAVIGLGIVWYSGPMVAVVGLVGLLGAWGYTQKPLNYKHRGLGVAFVFLLMGVLMVQGSYLAVSGELSSSAILHSLPLSCLISLLLLSNELRDYEKDLAQGIGTLAVGIGFASASRLYWGLIVAAYAISGMLISAGKLPPSPWLLLPLPLLPLLARYQQSADRRPLTPWTGRFLLLFGVGYMLALG